MSLPTRKPFKLKFLEPRESQVLPSVLEYLGWLKASKKVVWFSRMNSGAGKLLYPDGRTSQFMRFGFKGCPDIIGQLPGGRFFGVEAKSATGKSSEDQTEFRETSNEGGGLVLVARSVDDVLERIA